MRIAFTGIQKLTPEQARLVKEVVKEYGNELGATEFITGAAEGVDTLVAEYALEEFPQAYHHLIVPEGKHNAGVVSKFVQASFRNSRIIVEGMPLGTDHLDRNQAMVDAADALIAFPGTSDEQIRSGTWATVRRAQKKEIPLYVFPFDGGQAWHENVEEEQVADGT